MTTELLSPEGENRRARDVVDGTKRRRPPRSEASRRRAQRSGGRATRARSGARPRAGRAPASAALLGRVRCDDRSNPPIPHRDTTAVAGRDAPCPRKPRLWASRREAATKHEYRSCSVAAERVWPQSAGSRSRRGRCHVGREASYFVNGGVSSWLLGWLATAQSRQPGAALWMLLLREIGELMRRLRRVEVGRKTPARGRRSRGSRCGADSAFKLVLEWRTR